MSNSIKQAIKNLSAATGNIATAAGSLLVVTTEVVRDVTVASTDAITATPTVVKAVLTSPKDATVGFIKEDQGLTMEQAKLKVSEYLPESVAAGVTSGAVATGALIAMLFADDDANTGEGEEETHS